MDYAVARGAVKFFSTICQDELRRAFLRKGPIAIVRSAARRGADRTARARCVQQTNINSLNFCLAITWCGGQPVVHVSYGISRERPIPGGAVSRCFLERKLEVQQSGVDERQNLPQTFRS